MQNSPLIPLKEAKPVTLDEITLPQHTDSKIPFNSLQVIPLSYLFKNTELYERQIFPSLHYSVIFGWAFNEKDVTFRGHRESDKAMKKIKVHLVDTIRCCAINLQGLGKTPSSLLKNLNIGIYTSNLKQLGDSELDNQTLKTFAVQITKNLVHLQALKFIFYKSHCMKINGSGIEAFAFEFKKFVAPLKELSFSFFSCSNIKIKGYQNFLSYMCSPYNQLETLRPTFHCDHMFEPQLEYLMFNMTKYQVNLRVLELKLHFANYSINDEQLEIISSQISKYLENIRELSLDLITREYRNPTNTAHKKLTAKGLKAFVTNLGVVLQLKKLSVCFRFFVSLNDDALKTLGTEIARQLSGLEYFELGVIESEKVTGQGVKKLGSEICKNMTSLESLYLLFARCPGLFPNDLKALRTMITKKFPNLKNFRVSA